MEDVSEGNEEGQRGGEPKDKVEAKRRGKGRGGGEERRGGM